MPSRFAKFTNYLAIRWQRAPNLQVFTLRDYTYLCEQNDEF